MTPLRQRMIEDTRIRNLAPATQEMCLRHVAIFAQHVGKCPSKPGRTEIRGYEIHRSKADKVFRGLFNQIVASLRFLFRITLRRAWVVEAIRYPKNRRNLHVVLSREEVAQPLGAIRNLKHRALLMTLYGCGLRVPEATCLRAEDIDNQRMLLKVCFGKSGRQHQVSLSAKLLDALREYWRASRPNPWLFPSDRTGRPVLPASVRRACKKIARQIPPMRVVSPRILRHSYGTNLLEDGIDLRTIQVVLGHRWLDTMAIHPCLRNHPEHSPQHVGKIARREHLMTRRTWEVADVICLYGEDQRQDQGASLPTLQRRVLHAFETCRTSIRDGHVDD